MVVNKPYIEKELNDYITREFNKNDESDFVWHRDNEDRLIESVNKTNWSIQFDNELPIIIDGKILIKKGQYHRIICGDDQTVKIKVIKNPVY